MLVRKEGRSSKTIEGRWKIVILGGRVPHVWKKLQIKSSWRCSNHNVESTEIHLELCTFLVQWNIHHETSVLQLDITYATCIPKPSISMVEGRSTTGNTHVHSHWSIYSTFLRSDRG